MRNPNEARRTAVRDANQNKRPAPVHNKPYQVAKTYTATFNRQTRVLNDAKRK
jgi:hypothetical protein